MGLGREKPNRDPFLPDVTENRNYITTSALGQTVFGASDKVIFLQRFFSVYTHNESACVCVF